MTNCPPQRRRSGNLNEKVGTAGKNDYRLLKPRKGITGQRSKRIKNSYLTYESRQREAEAAAADTKNQLARVEMQLELIRQAEQSLSGYAEGARKVMQAARDGKLHGVRQTLASILDVEPDYENAVAGALGEFVDLIILENGKQAAKAISLVEEAEDQRAALMPLDWATGVSTFKGVGKSGILGMAAEYVHCPKEYDAVVNALLGSIPVVKDGATARAVLTGQPTGARAVTLRGELYCANGPVLVGKGGRGGTHQPLAPDQGSGSAGGKADCCLPDSHATGGKDNR